MWVYTFISSSLPCDELQQKLCPLLCYIELNMYHVALHRNQKTNLFFIFIIFFLSMSILFFKYSSLFILLHLFSSPFYLNFILLLPSSFFPLERALPLTVRFSHHSNTTLLHGWCIALCVYEEEKETDSTATLQSTKQLCLNGHWQIQRSRGSNAKTHRRPLRS